MDDTTTHSPNALTRSKDTFLFSHFPNLKAKKLKDINEIEYLAMISDKAREPEALKLKALSPADYKKAKTLQPFITGSIVTDGKGRKKENILALNGLAVVDFDELPANYDNWEALKAELAKDPYTFIVHYSLSGQGLCVFVKIDILNEFKEIYLSLKEYYFENFGAEIDVLDDETRLRFIAYDPKPIYKPDSLYYTDALPAESAPHPKTEISDFALLDKHSTDPATAFNYSGLVGLEVLNDLFTKLGYTITAGKKPTIYEYQRPGGSLKSLVAFYNQNVVKFEVFSSNTGLTKKNYNMYEMFKELKGLLQ